ncbi:hypothetical protein BGZ65_005421 [Modicella reniformis]|uniref:Uncharacterized protein n=1 Tax=Modicella reniformis TaxID=1440133 RepID=A0A9P6MB94_9FUNG|nr:hypothetical protein BGZ65_005421 [Modicella reniformis]
MPTKEQDNLAMTMSTTGALSCNNVDAQKQVSGKQFDDHGESDLPVPSPSPNSHAKAGSHHNTGTDPLDFKTRSSGRSQYLTNGSTYLGNEDSPSASAFQGSTAENNIDTRPQKADSKADPKVLPRPSRLAIPRAKASRTNLAAHTPNRLELENTFLLNQNNSLNRDIHYCRQTVQALKSILAQKEEIIERMKHEYRQAYYRTKLLERILTGHQKINFVHAAGLGPIAEKDQSLQRLFGFQEDEEEEEEWLDFWMRSLVESGDGEEEKGDNEEEKSTCGSQSDDKDHGPEHGKKKDFCRTYPDGDEDAREGESSSNKELFHELQLPSTFHSQVRTPTEQRLEAIPSSLYQQPNAPLHPSPMDTSEASVGRVQVLRRRPHLQLGSTTNESTSPAPSAALKAPHEPSVKILQNADPSQTSMDCLMGTECGSSKNNSSATVEGCAKWDRHGFLRDSGHFPPELFLFEEDFDLSGTGAQDQHSTVNSALSAPNNIREDERPPNLIVNIEDADSICSAGTTEPSRDLPQLDSLPKSNSHPSLGSDSPTAALALSARVHIEASTPFATLMGGLKAPQPAESHGSQVDHKTGRSESFACISNEEGGFLISCSNESNQEEGWSASSVATISSSTTDTQHSIGGGKKGPQDKVVRKDGSDSRGSTKSMIPLLPPVLRFSSRIKRSRLRQEKEEEGEEKNEKKVAAVSRALAISGVETPMPSGLATLPRIASISVESVELIDTRMDADARPAIPPISAPTTTAFWPRMWNGLGKRIPGLLNRSIGSKRSAHSGTRTVTLDESEVVQNAIPQPVEFAGGQPVGMRGFGIHRLLPRSRSRWQPTAPV